MGETFRMIAAFRSARSTRRELIIGIWPCATSGPQAVERVIAIVNQVSRGLVPRKRLAQLMSRPRRRGMRGDCHVPDASTIVGKEYQDEQEAIGPQQERPFSVGTTLAEMAFWRETGRCRHPRRRREGCSLS